ncbi:hypothetical protein [Cyclobacterium xiamenense]|uniref:hypothetical protein n=1 Tax=Cyclobacterium xiamenense TaxID=1297121 RepID=UPI0012B925B9|nr:hypothetical protein [Cyclobacterium xiamenense]
MVAPTFFLYLLLPVWILWARDPDPVFFQSDNLRDLKFESLPGHYTILDDGGEEIFLTGLKDRDGVLYWHRKLRTPVCLTGTCKLIDIGIYWHCTGDFLGLEVYGEHLTKTDHSDFSAEDYDKLMEILTNDWSKLREYELSDLVEEVYVEEPGVDGTSGATKKEIAAEAVKDAVYTTHTIWHLIHVGEKEQLMNLTAGELNKDASLIGSLLANDPSDDYRIVVLKLLADGKLREGNWKNSLVTESLENTDSKELQNLAIKSIAKCDYTDPSFLDYLTAVFPDFPTERKIQLVREFQKLPSIPDQLYRALVHDIENQQDWYIIGVFQLLKNKGNYGKELTRMAGKIGETDNLALKNILRDH